jgi:hypothetical protein
VVSKLDVHLRSPTPVKEVDLLRPELL